MKTSEIVERLLETDALTAKDDIYFIHESNLEYLVSTVLDISAEVTYSDAGTCELCGKSMEGMPFRYHMSCPSD